MAAQTAARMIADHSIVGLGTGSTIQYAIAELGRRVREEDLEIMAVTTSFQSQRLAKEHGILTLDSMNLSRLDIAIDGADEVDPKGDLIKGLGAALTKEKIVAAMAERYIIVVDQTKMVAQLGERTPVPVEVIPEAVALVERLLTHMGGRTMLRPDHSKAGPVVTDFGNVIVDAAFGVITDAKSLEQQINDLPGVVSNGLLLSMVDEVVVGSIASGRVRVMTQSFRRKK